MPAAERRLAAIMFTDIVGYTALAVDAVNCALAVQSPLDPN